VYPFSTLDMNTIKQVIKISLKVFASKEKNKLKLKASKRIIKTKKTKLYFLPLHHSGLFCFHM